VREGGHEEVVLLRVYCRGDRSKIPDESRDLAVGVRVGPAGGGEEVAGPAEEVCAGVRDAGELAPGHRVPADEAQAPVLGLTHDGHLCARDVGDERFGRLEFGDHAGYLRDRGRQHDEVGATRLLQGRGPVDGAQGYGLL
jgi:hypothetical protein